MSVFVYVSLLFFPVHFFSCTFVLLFRLHHCYFSAHFILFFISSLHVLHLIVLSLICKPFLDNFSALFFGCWQFALFSMLTKIAEIAKIMQARFAVCAFKLVTHPHYWHSASTQVIGRSQYFLTKCMDFDDMWKIFIWDNFLNYLASIQLAL